MSYYSKTRLVRLEARKSSLHAVTGHEAGLGAERCLAKMPPKKQQNPKVQYFDSIKQEKINSLRWCLRHGGITLTVENDDEHTGIQIAAAGGYLESLEVLLEYVSKGLGTQEDQDRTDVATAQPHNPPD